MRRNPFKSSTDLEALSTTAVMETELLAGLTKLPGKMFLDLAIGGGRMISPGCVDLVRGGSPTAIILSDGTTVHSSRYSAEQIAELLRSQGVPMLLFRKTVGPGVYMATEPVYVNANGLTGFSAHPDVVLHLRSPINVPLLGFKSKDLEAAVELVCGPITYASPERSTGAWIPNTSAYDPLEFHKDHFGFHR